MTRSAPPAAGPCLEGVAFPLGVRLLATLMVGALLYWGLASADSMLHSGFTPAGALLLAAALGLVLWCLRWMWASRTSADAMGIRQTWLWRKQVRWCDIAQARIVGVPGLEWLVAPRLVVRPRGGGLMVFHSADRKVLAAFARFVTTGSAGLGEPPAMPVA